MIRTIPFYKVESVGNDFVLVLASDVQGVDLPTLALNVCRRHFSVGSDGLLVLAREGNAVRLRMFNPDGTEDFCGNGIRCAAIMAQHLGWVDSEGTIHHLDKTIHVELDENVVRSTLDPANFTPSAVPVCSIHEMFMSPLNIEGRQLRVSSLTTGSTHTVVLSDELPNDEEFLSLGPAIENHPLFPERTSVIWAVPEGEDALKIRIWERGAGETQGCGTGSSAAAAVYFRKRNAYGSLKINNPGGTVIVTQLGPHDPMITEATAEIVYRGNVNLVPSTAPNRV